MTLRALFDDRKRRGSQDNYDRTQQRTFLAGIGAVGVTAGLAGCGGLPGSGPDVDLEYGDEIEGEITEDSPEDPIYEDLAEPHTF